MPYDNTNSGILSKNKRKEKETHADYTGSINVGGVHFWLSAWLKTGREGTKLAGERYFSLSVKPKDGAAPARSSSSANGAPQAFPTDGEPDDVPF